MTPPSLTALSDQIDALASDRGDYVVVCGRTGERPVPIDGRRFASRTRAERAARAAERYRATLRRYDRRLPFYDLIVQEERWPTGDATGGRIGESTP
ncbi:DUF7552 domain-containing protein [Halobellus sp. EA9]|uniref:DUF7552 domain-containing protein n=1 Tax=Halobellus sp. EA9 TaxID=3421647 RepID=UPI003EBC1748